MAQRPVTDWIEEEGRMGIGEALFKIRKFLESHGADEEVIRAWEELRDDITRLISEMMHL